MPRSLEDLERFGLKFWPAALIEREQETSILPKLLETQEKFIGILYVADGSPSAWKDVLRITSGMPANLFLKHLMVLSDLGGENLKRYRTNVRNFFPDAQMRYIWKEKHHTYSFRSLHRRSNWSNPDLKVDGAGLAKAEPLSDAIEDVAMLLLHGGSSVDPNLPETVLTKCVLGSLLGQKRELDLFVRQRYLYVSRITGGAKSNAMGQLCQQYVKEHLEQALPNWDFSRHTIPKMSQNAGRTDMNFDIVAKSPTGGYCAVEVSFQVTTNSTIERKMGQAATRQELLHAAGHNIAYVIDGAGNFERRSALSTICAHSDCTVSFADADLKLLTRYLKTLE